MELIKEPKKVDVRQRKPNQSEFSFLKKSASVTAKEVRNRLNRYFANFPNSGQKELKSRFNTDFNAAFFELFVHQLFFENGFNLKEHPKISNTRNHPDFLINKNGESFYLECKKFDDLSDEERSIERYRDSILTKLSCLTSPFYLYNIKEFIVLRMEESTDIDDFLDDVQGLLNQDPLIEEDESNYVHSEPTLETNEIVLKLQITLRRDWKVGRNSDELLGWHLGNTRVGFPENSLSKGIFNKMTKYGKTNRPLIVSININSRWYRKRKIFERVLYRTGIYDFSSGQSNYTDDGLFEKNKGKLSHVYGVLVFFGAQPYNNDDTDFVVYRNPYFKTDLSDLEFITQCKYEIDEIIYTEGSKLNELIKE